MTADAQVSAVLRDLDRRQVAQPRHRGRDRLRDRALHLPGRQLRPRAAVGDRAGAVPARRDPWQVMLSTDHPNGGSFLSYPKLIRLLMDRAFREDQMGRANQQGDPAHGAARRARPRVHARRDRDHHPRGPRAAARAARQGPPRRRRRRRRDDLPRPRRPRGDVRHAALRDQGRRARGRRRRAAPSAGRALLRVGRPLRPRRERRARAAVRRPLHGAFEHYPVRDPALREPRADRGGRG